MEATTINPGNTASLYVGNLSPDVNEQHLWETFSVVGNVSSVKICRDCVTRRSLCYGYVNFTSAESADQAHRELNFSLIKGRPCRVMRSQRDPLKRKNGEGNLMVKNLDKNTTDRQLYEVFSQFGSVLSCKISKDNSTGESRGFGFVQFESEDVAKNIQDQGHVTINGKAVEVIPFIRKSDRVSRDIPVTNLYIKNFPKSWTQEMLSNIFSAFGEITSLALNKDAKDRPFGFVNFAESSSAELAISECNGRVCTENGTLKDPSEETEEDKKIPMLDDESSTKDDIVNDKKGVRMYVSRAQTKFERESSLRAKFEQKVAVRSESPQGVVLYVKNLPDDKDDEGLRELFASAGTVISTYVMRDNKGSSRGFGFVTMASKDEAARAISELHSRILGGKPLFVCLHEKSAVRRQRLAEEFSRPRVMNGFTGAPQMMMGHPAGVPSQRVPGMYPGNSRGGRRPFPAPSHPMMGGMPIPHQQHFQYMMQQQQQMFAQQHQQQMYLHQQQAAKFSNMLNMEEGQRRQMLGEHIYARIHQHHPAEAAKVTGMMLEMDPVDLISMLQDETRLNAKVNEALAVLDSANRQPNASASSPPSGPSVPPPVPSVPQPHNTSSQ